MEPTLLEEVMPEKPKRKRKDWVYKSDYDHLKFKYNLLKWASIALVVGLLFVIKFTA